MALHPAERKLLLDNPDLFIARYFSDEIYDLEDFHLRLITNATTKRRSVILYPAAHGKCCAPDTPVLMQDGILRRAADVLAGDDLAGHARCVASESNGVGPTLRVTLTTGQSIVVTPNHRFAVRLHLDEDVVSWVEAASLVEGHEVVLEAKPGGGARLTDGQLSLLGYVIGDGSVKCGNCLVTSGDEVLRDHIVAICDELGFKTNAVGRDVRMSGGARQWLRDLGVYGRGSYEKRVPVEVFRADARQLRIFLAAYHACDGSFTQGRSGFEFYSVSEHLLRDVQSLLLKLGVIASLSRKNGTYLANAHQSWRLRIPSAHFDEVRKWPILLERKIPNRGEDVKRYLPRVRSVEDAGEQETWAIQTTSGTHFTADMLTHNTTLVSTLLPIWALCRDPNIRITIIAKNDLDAKAIMRSMQSQMEGNDLLIEDFGPFKPLDGENKPWSLSELSVHKRTRIHPRPTVQAKGSGANIFGHRSDWVICVPAGTQVQTKSGPRAVERLTLEDLVLTHEGRFKPIERLGRREAEEIVRVRVHSEPEPIEMTPEHPLLTQRGWVEAGEIKAGDLVAAAGATERLDHEWGEDFWELAGWWLAEGGLESRFVRLTLGADEREQAERLREIGARYGTSASIRERSSSNAIEVLIYGKRVIDFFREWDRDGVCQKAIPGWVELLPDEKLKAMVRGYVLGDGHPNGVTARGWRVTSVSLPLLQGVQRCLARVGLWASICHATGPVLLPRQKQTPYLLLVGAEALHWLGIRAAEVERHQVRSSWAWDGERIWLKVKEVERIQAPVTVYNLTVRDDHSFSAGPLITHNCDDVVTDKNSATPEAREKFAQWFHQGVETMPEHVDSRLTVVGTLFDPADLYHDLMETIDPTTGEPIYHKQHEDAIVDEDQQITLWPKRWPWRRLMLQKLTLGTLDFNKRYRNIAVDRSRLIFKEAYVKGGYHLGDEFPGCLDRDYEIGDFDETWHIYGGFDPAIGVKKNAKFVAHITLAVGSCSIHERCFWVVDIERDQMTLPQQADMILDKHDHYGMICSRIETNAYQKGLEQVVRERMDQRGVAFRIEPHTTGRNKIDPEIGVQALGPWFERGAFHIPWRSAHSQRRMRPLVDELITYPGRTTDTVMALWVAWTGAEQGLARYASFNRLEDRGSMWSTGRPRPLGCYVVENPIFRAD